MAQRVAVETSMGSFTLELYTRHAPKTCQNFVELARRGYYDGTVVRFFSEQRPPPTSTDRPNSFFR